MVELDRIVHEAVDGGAAPFLVAAVADRSRLIWEGSAGRANATHDAGPDTVFRLFSATKAIGSLMALIAIDRGWVTLDTPVGEIVPSFDSLKVLEEITDDGPVFRRPNTRATLRHLLTHTQGQAYSAFHPLQAEYEKLKSPTPDLTGLLESLNCPLMFDPGTGFAYGIGTDWVGHLVSTLDGRAVDRFVREEILEPLAMSNTSFEIGETSAPLADVSQKREDGSFEYIEQSPPSRPKLYQMGSALYSTTSDYLRFLRFVLNHGELDGTRLISRRTADLMLSDQMNGVAIPTPILTSLVPFACNADIVPGTRKTHTACCFMNLESAPGLRRPNSLFWSGLLNTHYWVDLASNIAAVFFSQMLPFCDPDLMRSFEQFERAVYAGRIAG